MKKQRCSLSYHRIRIDELNVFAGGVNDGVYGNETTFADPPVAANAFAQLLTDFINKRNLYKQGGAAQKGPYLASLDALMDALDTLAAFVDTIADGDANIITLAGYVPTKGTSSTVPAPSQASGVKLTRGSTGELLAECDNQAFVLSYMCVLTEGGPLSPDIVINGSGQLVVASEATDNAPEATIPSGTLMDLNTNRKKRFLGLDPGTTYYAVFSVTNASGVGQLSEPRSILCA